MTAGGPSRPGAADERRPAGPADRTRDGSAGRTVGAPAAVRARAWCRVDLAGGTLDIWPLGLLHPGARTVNVAVGVPATVRLERRHRTYRVRQGDRLAEGRTAEELATHSEGALVGTLLAALGTPPVEAELATGSPRGAGLGGSSALGVALVAAAERLAGVAPSGPSADATARLVRDLEARLMGLPTGI